MAGMCAIYTAMVPPTPEELATLAKTNESKQYGARRCTLGRKAVAELVTLVAPASHRALADAIVERDLWSFLTPAAARGNHAATLQRAHPELVVPFPLWPESIPLACLVGSAPAHYIGNNLVMLPPDLVVQGVEAFEKLEATNDSAGYLNEYLRTATHKRDAVLLHWDYR